MPHAQSQAQYFSPRVSHGVGPDHGITRVALETTVLAITAFTHTLTEMEHTLTFPGPQTSVAAGLAHQSSDPGPCDYTSPIYFIFYPISAFTDDLPIQTGARKIPGPPISVHIAAAVRSRGNNNKEKEQNIKA